MSPIGILLIPLGLLLFFAGSRPLFWATVIGAQFYYVKVLNFGTPVTLTLWFGGLLILRKACDVAFSGGRMRPVTLPGWRMLAAFFAVALLSLFLPRLLAGRLQVVSLTTSYKDYVTAPLRFRMGNLTQLAYPIFMTTLLLSLASEVRDRRTLAKVLQVSFLCAIGVLLSGLFFQFGRANGLGGLVDQVFWLFTGSHELRSVSQAFGSFSRMFSLAGEPGYTGAYLLFILGIAGVAAFAPWGDPVGWPRRRVQLMFAAAMGGIILTGGTTGFAGLVLFIGALVGFSTMARPDAAGVPRDAMSRLARGLIGAALVFSVVLIAAWPLITGRSFIAWVFQQHVQKVLVESDEGSGDIRMETVLTSLEIFARSPLIGVGYGSHRANALLAVLLSNTGLLGTLSFLAFNGAMVYTCIRVSRRSRNPGDIVVAVGLGCALVSFLGVALIAKGAVTFLFGYYWLMLALIAALPRITASDMAAVESAPLSPEAGSG